MSVSSALREHWPEYLIEVALLGCFMISIGFLVTVFESPKSLLYLRIPSVALRTGLLAASIGIALSLLIQSPWGKRSGAHMNPAITLAFLRLKRIHPWDAVFYVSAQAIGGTLGVAFVAFVMGDLFTDPPIKYAVTVPGPAGETIAFFAETSISFFLMTTILIFVSSPRLIRFTASAIGALVAILIIIEAPLSGASMNPARTFASAVPGMMWQHVWLYLTGPTLGMLIAAQLHDSVRKNLASGCAKLLHPRDVRCIHCGYLCD
jgi:aquaporin Z